MLRPKPHLSLQKTRLAPTPSGYLHLGNLFSFVLTLTLARKAGARVLLRIDDMDQQRTATQFVEDIFDTLQFLELPFDEGPTTSGNFELEWSQTRRLQLYETALQHLLTSGQIFACTCSRAEIAQLTSDGSYPGTCRNKGLPLDLPGCAWRIKTPSQTAVRVPTWQGVTTVAEMPASVRDFIVRKKDGFPAYHLCSLVDDLHFGIDLVVRGKDLWPSTVAQVWLSNLLPQNSFSQSVFVHHPLLMSASGEKLSKSTGSTSAHGLRNAGLDKAAVFQKLARLLGLPSSPDDWSTLAEAMENQLSVYIAEQ